MPQQLKQFVENSRKQREYRPAPPPDLAAYGSDADFGKHFLAYGGARPSSDDEAKEGKFASAEPCDDNGAALDMTLHE